MTATSRVLPPLPPIPGDISNRFQDLLRQPPDDQPALEAWLLELVKNSGHLSNADDLRWRVLALVWLAHLNTDKAWPYLMWLNMNEPLIQEHLAEILAEALDEYEAYLQFSTWRATASDERLQTFFGDFKHTPPAHRLPALFCRLLAHPNAPGVAEWLTSFCRDTVDPPLPLRRWRLLAAVWLATRVDCAAGYDNLLQMTGGRDALSAGDLRLLADAAAEVNAVAVLTQWIAECPDPSVRNLLADFGHPDLPALARSLLDAPPNYNHLTGLVNQAAADVALFRRVKNLLDEAGIFPANASLLNLACGLLAPQTALLTAVGYRVIGVDLHIPPRFLPVPGPKAWIKRRRHVQAWQSATAAYYRALSGQAGLTLNWKRVAIELADLTRLRFADAAFDAALCLGYLHHAPDVRGLLAEAARVLKPGGLLLVDIRPFPALTGAFSPPDAPPWGHLRNQPIDAEIPLNRWRESQYRQAFKERFTVEQWQTTQDDQAIALLTPELQAELSGYTVEELTRKEIFVLARKPGAI